jgi:hypothetical protein
LATPFFHFEEELMKDYFKTIETKKLLSWNHANCTGQEKVYGQEKNCDVLCALEKIGRHLELVPQPVPFGKYTIITLPNWQLLFFILRRS